MFSIIDCPVSAERLDAQRVRFAPDSYKFGRAPNPFVLRLDADAPSRPSWMRLVGERATSDDATTLAVQAAVLSTVSTHPGLSGSKLGRLVRHRKDAVLQALETLRRAGRVDCYTRGQAQLWFVPNAETPHE